MIKKIFNAVIFVLFIIMFLYIADSCRYRNEDVNRDGVVDALDLLIVQKYIIEEHKKGVNYERSID